MSDGDRPRSRSPPPRSRERSRSRSPRGEPQYRKRFAPAITRAFAKDLPHLTRSTGFLDLIFSTGDYLFFQAVAVVAMTAKALLVAVTTTVEVAKMHSYLKTLPFPFLQS